MENQTELFAEWQKEKAALQEQIDTLQKQMVQDDRRLTRALKQCGVLYEMLDNLNIPSELIMDAIHENDCCDPEDCCKLCHKEGKCPPDCEYCEEDQRQALHREGQCPPDCEECIGERHVREGTCFPNGCQYCSKYYNQHRYSYDESSDEDEE